MPRLHVCSLARVHSTVRQTGARSLVSLITPPMSIDRPEAIAAARHLHLAMSDIVEPEDGHVLPGAAHVARLLDFVRQWDRRAALVIHCYAGVSRSTAAAFIAACALAPDHSENAFAQAIRAASPTATPNPLLVALADELLDRKGRMVAAVAAIGRGADCFEGAPFALDLPQ